MLNKEAKTYLKQIRHLLPILSKQEKRFLKDLESALSDYISAYPHANTDEISAKFGSPADVVHDYIESLDLDYIIRRISARKIIKRAIAILILLALLAFALVAGTTYKAYLDSKNSVITQEVTIIE